MRARDKICSRTDARDQIAEARRARRRVVFTSGCFDLLHIGHLRAFEEARQHGDLLVIGVNRDRRLSELKGPGRPLVPERQRAELIAGLAVVDLVVLFGEDTAGPLIRFLSPDVVCKGGEYKGQDIEEKLAVESIGGDFVFLRQTPGVRTSAIIARLG